MEPYGEANVEVLFLPFQLGSRQCSVLFLNEKVGEFLYSVEAEGVLPPPSHLPYQPTARSVRISSATAAERSKGLFGGDDRVVYWQCEVDQSVTEEILLPASNIAKENALSEYDNVIHSLMRLKIFILFPAFRKKLKDDFLAT